MPKNQSKVSFRENLWVRNFSALCIRDTKITGQVVLMPVFSFAHCPLLPYSGIPLRVDNSDICLATVSVRVR